jgi:hypothetical protein
MDSQAVFRDFSAREASLPIFSRAWWLDATAGPDCWNAAVVTRGGKVCAAMPYVVRRRYGMTVIGQPALTQKLGPWFLPAQGRHSTRLAHEKEMMQALIEQLPRFDHFSQNWHYGSSNWLPFSWNGFHQTTRYTYVLGELKVEKTMWTGMEDNTRNNCKKAVGRHGLRVRDDLPLDAFLELNRMTYQRQNLNVPYTDELVRRIDAACAERGCRKFLIAEDPDGRLHSGLYFVWDENSAYGLMAGSDPVLRNSGANSLCHWEAIKYAAGVTQRFDFAGSMMEPVERFFRGFGAVQLPYFNLTKTPSRMLRMRQGLLSVLGKTPC